MVQRVVKWGVLACGKIAAEFASALKDAGNGELWAVAARDRGRAEAFAETHGAARAFDSYAALLEDPEIEAVYIATLHPFHLEWIGHALNAGKHVLCEKPLAMNFREASAAAQMARETGLLLREAFMYRYHPQTANIVDLVTSGRVGDVRMIDASFCYDSGIQPDSRLQAKELGGGAILDIGCYGMSYSRLIAGQIAGRPFAEPVELQAVGHIDPQLGTDMWTTAVMRFEGGLIARVNAALRLQTGTGTTVYGTRGRIRIDNPWHCVGEVRVEDQYGQLVEIIEPDKSRPLLTYEIEAFGAEVRGESSSVSAPGMSLEDTLGNMKCLDQWRDRIGLHYPADSAT